MLIWLITPLAASLLLRAFAGDGWKDMGIKPAIKGNVPRLLVGTIAASIVFGEIRILTDSVWPAVLMHTVGGAFVGALLLEDLIKMTSGMEFLVSPGIEGGLSIVLFTAIGVGIHLLRRKRTAIRPLSAAAPAAQER